ncbi:Threonine synthase-like 1 [Dissostichus eleginoides]|uniref:Threonine synthase-like 1 n=1 Tax=Dissostichus eleginoides TaxID=100907 RepID=A0AAD9BJR0_DISEL|nr:Threonine synthase-like 1 [Dissostichus eleginoides]
MGLLNALRAVRCYLSPLSTSKSWLSTKASLLGDRNILLMGAPGAGKTTVGRIVAHRLGLPVIDVDDDVLEKSWKMPVAAKLAAVGGERFLEEEGDALCNFSASGCVVSLTGSNPLHTAAMKHIKESGLVIYLDVDSEDIVQRLTRMKVNRIVGQETGTSMRDILHYRKQFYERWLDLRVLCGTGDTVEEVAEKVLKAIERYQNHASETFVSTRSDSVESKTLFSDVVVEGLATDGGLYVPKNGFPNIDAREWLRLMCNYLILVATSGDTGSAVLSGFSRLSGSDTHRTGVLVFFPEEGVSEIQKLQMMSFREGNARAVSVLSDFDFCQRSIKRMFGEGGLTGHLAVEYSTVLSTANSINWARLLPQVVYHSSAYLDLCRDGVIKFGEPIDVCIPSGNFGNAMSAVYAKQMGIPIRRIICASNHNRIITDFITTGEYDLRARPLALSHSPAIDILKSSNLERFIFHVSDGDGHLVKELFTRLDRQQHFQSVHTHTGYLMDTHTAVAKVVADRLQDASCPMVLCSTAHYGKFAPAVFKALQIQNIPEDPVEQLKKLGSTASRPGIHRDMMKCLEGSSRKEHTVCQAEYGALVEEVDNMIQSSFLKVM